MQKIAVMTEDEVEDLINKCLTRHSSIPNPEPKSEPELEGERYLHSIKELSAFLDCSTTTCQKLKNSGKIRYKQFGRKVLFVASEVLEDIGKNSKINKKKA